MTNQNNQIDRSKQRRGLALGFLVKKPGVLSLLQDSGRYGYAQMGLTQGGPADKEAFYWANRLCENNADAAVIEVSVGGIELLAQLDTVLAVTGAVMKLCINSQEMALWRSHHIKAGDTITLDYAQTGLRCYVAVKGGFMVKASFGSVSTVCRESIGGLSGDKLSKNEILPYVEHKALANETLCLLPEQQIPQYGHSAILRTIPSYQQHHFSAFEQRLFYSSEYTVSSDCDRMGYRLQGRAIHSEVSGILSEGICHGAVQIPADGQPIVLINDRQTIGGYPKIGSVISSDTNKLAQLRPTDKVRFTPISMEKAHNIFHLACNKSHKIELLKCK
ncbi:biotin-dependent carboxyltransferase family protein [Litorilituus lipolyticus]|uniref:Biotin-dependent carboxyltransferase n=1 Tax=Litorilituus lipolyticus TaxID=2491017 RepID=A0A502KRY2_9GAMM|nr:biotin-dependent carboxyltransferase family protein [Litorilituus lipolyticus]TPH13954.1 biotin-dependent carboxyltransferase [Litorilituus lipolyticus]